MLGSRSSRHISSILLINNGLGKRVGDRNLEILCIAGEEKEKLYLLLTILRIFQETHPWYYYSRRRLHFLAAGSIAALVAAVAAAAAAVFGPWLP